MRYRLPALIILACACAPGSVRAQVDLSCIGVQALGARMKIQSLGASGEAHRPVMTQIEALQRNAMGIVKQAEDDWGARRDQAIARIRSASPGASDAAVQREIMRMVVEQDQMDRSHARLLLAQAEAHLAEERIIVASRRIPGPDNARQVADTSRRFAESSGVRQEVVAAIQRSPAMQQLVGVLATSAAAARSSQDFPTAPLAAREPRAALAGERFDRDNPGARVEVIAQVLANTVAEADAQRTYAHLVRVHNEGLLGPAETRAQLTTNPNQATAREVNMQFGQSLVKLQKANEALAAVNSIKLDRIEVRAPEVGKPAAEKAWTDKVVNKAEEAVQTIYNYIYVGLPPPSALPGAPPTQSAPPAHKH